MTERKKLIRKKKETEEISVEKDKPSKLEYEISKYLRNNLPVKKTFLLRDKVEYFIASKAINCLLDSKWAKRSPGDSNEPLFTTRESVVDFLNLMLQHRFFHRAKKIFLVKDRKKIKERENEDLLGDSEYSKRKEKNKSNEDGKRKDRTKIKLDIHMEQIVVDSNEPYVWIYDPISFWSWIFGFLIVFGVVALCLFPLWPSSLRNSVYYLSVLAAFFLVTIMAIALLKIIIFLIIWSVTFGKHYFWLLPNLTEDVGFFASFWPLYYHTTSDEKLKEKEKEKNKNKKLKSNNLSQPTNKNEEKKLKKNSYKDEEVLEEENLNETKNDEVRTLRKDDVSDSSENDSLKNNGFEIVDDKEVPPILDIKL